ncbi:UNVERIFIED_CONTAM: hypothetical protein PYX00_007144 [Menopon gallinae]|uniref:BZIP domain-containing protein n=1 Tax=Menopon gallinae TaxID=328185 RepID=A0AAW2HHN9_9NEOP
MTMGSRGALPTEDAMTAFSALHLLRNYNQLFTSTGSGLISGYPYTPGNMMEVHHLQRDNRFPSDWPPVLGAFQPYLPAPTTPVFGESKGRLLLTSALSARRPRGEKKPIPDEQKDDRYYERRKRNNQAAKKSRDARKLREDQIALRAALLEHENAVLRAQIVTLREETQSLRQLLFVQGKVHRTAITSGDDEYKASGISELCERSCSTERKSD